MAGFRISFVALHNRRLDGFAGLIFLGICVVGRPIMFGTSQQFSATTSEKRAW
jgi:hypothetical protein